MVSNNSANNHDPRGSVWEKWDLHTHTYLDPNWQWPSKFPEKRGKKIKKFNKEFIKHCIDTDISVVAITDHNTGAAIDKLLEMKEAMGNPINIIPGVEVISTEGIHIVCLFDSLKTQKDSNNRWGTWEKTIDNFLTKIQIPKPRFKDEITRINPEISKINCDSIIETAKKFSAISIFSHSYSANSGLFKRGNPRQRKRVLGKCNIIGLAASYDNLEKRRKNVEKKLKNYGFQPRNYAFVNSSDARCVKDVGSKFTWIKSNPNFEGLKQVVYEPQERTFIGMNDPNKFDYPIISSIKIKGTKDFFFKDNVEIFFNKNLISVIGSRGTGKSALLDLVALSLGKKSVVLSNDTKTNYIKSFLNESGELEVIIGLKRSSSLEEKKYSVGLSRPNIDNLESLLDVEYFPQKGIGRLADPKSYKGESQLSDFIKRRVFKGKAKERIDKFEKFRDGTTERLKENRDDILGLQREIKKEKDYRAIKKKVSTQLEQLDSDEIKELVRKRAFIIEQQEKKSHLLSEISFFKQKISKLIKEIENSYPFLIKEKSFVGNDRDSDEKELEIELSAEWSNLRANFYGKDIKTFHESLKEMQRQIEALEEKTRKVKLLKDPQTKSDIEEKIEEIKKDTGLEIDEETIFSLQEEQKEIEQKLKNIKKYKGKRKKLFEQRNEILTGYKEEIGRLKESLRKDFDAFMKTEGRILNNSIKIEFRNDKLPQKIFNTVKERRIPNDWRFPDSGFKKIIKEKSTNLIIRCFKDREFQEWGEVKNFGENSAHSFQSIENSEEIALYLEEILPQLKFTLKWSPEETSKYKALDECSIGERSTAVLSIILVSGTNPLIIDQPEDDLDHNYLYEPLAKKIIRSVKKRRQLILATHNANIVVNGDSEQILVLESKKFGKGSIDQTTIENKKKRESLTTILEGGNEAFKKREQRYDIKLDNPNDKT